MPVIRRLIWDTWNVTHIARHNVTPDEVEEVCHGRPLTSANYKGRIRLIGPTQSGRMLCAILAPTDREGVYYPVTARPADRKERRGYAQHINEEPL
jgi:uncharacterized DUF497 family protein